jgi:hypothetical protein
METLARERRVCFSGTQIHGESYASLHVEGKWFTNLQRMVEAHNEDRKLGFGARH